MRKKRHTPEEIIRKLREAEVALAQGQTVDPGSQPTQPVLVSSGAGGDTVYTPKAEILKSWRRVTSVPGHLNL